VQYYELPKEDTNTYSIYMDYLPKMSLDIYSLKFSMTLSLRTKISFLYNLSLGLRFLKSQEIIYMDVTPSNLLLNNNL
jgi:serine/threonine protein kinase